MDTKDDDVGSDMSMYDVILDLYSTVRINYMHVIVFKAGNYMQLFGINLRFHL